MNNTNLDQEDNLNPVQNRNGGRGAKDNIN